MYENETPEAAEYIKGLFARIDAVIDEPCEELTDQIGLLITCILTRVAKMAQQDKSVKPRREVDKICIALKKEWISYQRLVDQHNASLN